MAKQTIIKEKFDNFKNENLSFDNKDNIIFILGMPRSGTSLVEQIITSHSNVFGGGELPILSKIIKENFINEENSIRDDFDKNLQDVLTIEKLRFEYFNFIKNFDYKEKFSTLEEEVRELHWFKKSIRGWIACRLIRWNMKVRKKMKERKNHIPNPDNPVSKALRGETI